MTPLPLSLQRGRAVRYIPEYEKLRLKKPCFSISGDAASIPHAKKTLSKYLNLKIEDTIFISTYFIFQKQTHSSFIIFYINFFKLFILQAIDIYFKKKQF